MFTQTQIEEMVDLLLTLDKSTKIYLGCDSVRFMRNDRQYAKFATVAIVHMNGKNGCKIFKNISVESNYDVKKNRPSMRLMTEVQKVCELYTQIIPFIDEYDVEVHLDISQDPEHGSNCVASQAAGYVLGVTGLGQDKVKLKPDAIAASFGADRAVNKSE